MADGDAAINWPGGHSPRFLIASGFSREDDLSVGDRVRERTARSGVELDFKSQGGLTGAAPAGLVSGLQQALLSLIANVTQQMQICSRPCSTISLASGHQFWLERGSPTRSTSKCKPDTALKMDHDFLGGIAAAHRAALRICVHLRSSVVENF